MSYTRNAIATTITVTVTALVLTAAGPGTQPAAASGGLVGLQEKQAISQRQNLQAPEVTPDPVFVTAIYAENQEQQETAEWALEQMAEAGFQLPPVTIHMHEDRHDCSNEPGGTSNGYFTQSKGENIIHSCGSAWVLVHELAHVWDKTMLDDGTRQLVLDHQGLETWSNATWNQAGGEHMASIIAWAIEGTHPSAIGYYDRDHLAEAYEIVLQALPESTTT